MVDAAAAAAAQRRKAKEAAAAAAAELEAEAAATKVADLVVAKKKPRRPRRDNKPTRGEKPKPPSTSLRRGTYFGSKKAGTAGADKMLSAARKKEAARFMKERVAKREAKRVEDAVLEKKRVAGDRKKRLAQAEEAKRRSGVEKLRPRREARSAEGVAPRRDAYGAAPAPNVATKRAVALGRAPAVAPRERAPMGPRERAAQLRGRSTLSPKRAEEEEECAALDASAVDEFFRAALGHSMASHSEACVQTAGGHASRRHEEILNTVSRRLLEVVRWVPGAERCGRAVRCVRTESDSPIAYPPPTALRLLAPPRPAPASPPPSSR